MIQVQLQGSFNDLLTYICERFPIKTESGACEPVEDIMFFVGSAASTVANGQNLFLVLSEEDFYFYISLEQDDEILYTTIPSLKAKFGLSVDPQHYIQEEKIEAPIENINTEKETPHTPLKILGTGMIVLNKLLMYDAVMNLKDINTLLTEPLSVFVCIIHANHVLLEKVEV